MSEFMLQQTGSTLARVGGLGLAADPRLGGLAPATGELGGFGLVTGRWG